MSIEWAFGLLGLLAMGGIVAFLAWNADRVCRTTIEGTLLQYHATDIKLKFDWMDWDRDNSTYDVEYTDTSGKRRYNRCKVSSRKVGPRFDDDTVYWQSPVIPPLTDTAEGQS